MSVNIFDTAYEHVSEAIKTDESLSALIRPNNIVEYSQKDNSKWVSTTADYPKVEVLWESLSPAGTMSNGERYDATFRVTVAVGQVIYRKMTQLLLEIARIVNGFKTYRPQDETGYVYGCSHSPISVGPFQPEKGRDTIHGWAFQFSITFGVCLKRGIQ